MVTATRQTSLATLGRAAALAALALGSAAHGHRARAADPAPPGDPAATATPSPGEEAIPTGIAERITRAESAFRVQNYPRVVELLDSLVNHPKLEGRPEQVKVLEWLGAAHWFMNVPDAARLAFGQLLKESPFHTLDPFVYPEQLIAFFEARRKELIDANVIPSKPEPGPDTGPRAVLVRTVTRHDTPTLAYVVPFGVGQFANDDIGKGATFAALQGIGVVTMAATWLGIEGLKVSGTNKIAESDRGQANLLNAMWYVGLGVFVTSWAFSIADGFANRQAGPTIDERLERLEPSDLPPTPPRVILGPGPGDLGVGLGVLF